MATSGVTEGLLNAVDRIRPIIEEHAASAEAKGGGVIGEPDRQYQHHNPEDDGRQASSPTEAVLGL